MDDGAGAASRAVDRGLAILEAIAQRAAGLTNAELSRRLGVPKSSATYILRALERRGYVRRDADGGRYRIGLKVLALGRHALSGLGLRDAARPVLRALADRTELSAHLAVLDGGEAVYVERVEAPGFVKMDTWVGRRMEAHSTAVGKAILASLPESEVEAIVRDRGLPRRTSRTITAAPRLQRELERVRRRGYAVDDQENNAGVRCVAAPVFDPLGRVRGSVGVSGTTVQVHAGTLPRLARQVREAARRVAASGFGGA